MADTNTTTTNATKTTACYYACPQRLPCGICRLTMAQCPKWWDNGPHITWTTGTAVNAVNLSRGTTSCTCHIHGGDERE